MKKYYVGIMCLALGMVSASCNTNTPKQAVDKKPPQEAAPTEKFTGILFASRNDTSCGMPLSAGVEDTVVLGGKIFGFCSAECKAGFVAQLQKQQKR